MHLPLQFHSTPHHGSIAAPPGHLTTGPSFLRTCRRRNVWYGYAVLPWPWEHLCSTHQEPNCSFGGRCPNCLSLRVSRPKPICQQWLVRDQSVFRQQAQYSASVQRRQPGGFSTFGAFLFSHHRDRQVGIQKGFLW